MAAPTTCCSREKSSCQPGAVHTWLQVAILIEEADGAKVARFSPGIHGMAIVARRALSPSIPRA